jgi:hypothetical protein
MRGFYANIQSAIVDVCPDIKLVATPIKVVKPRIRLRSCENIAAAAEQRARLTPPRQAFERFVRFWADSTEAVTDPSSNIREFGLEV